MTVPNLPVQIDASAHLIASQIINDETCRIGDSHLVQLEEYIESIVLYNQVVLPVKVGHEERIKKAAAPLIWKEGILNVEVVLDMEERMQRAKDTCIRLALSSKSKGKKKSDVLCLNNFARSILKSTPGREREFREHIPLALQLPGTREILNNLLSDPEYSAISDEEKISIWYLLRSFCFVPIAIERKRPFRHNYYRTTFAQCAYSEGEKDYLQAKDLELFAPSFRKINATMASRQCFPMFLPYILKQVDRRCQIEEAILCLRDSASAKRLREYHLELISDYDEEHGKTIFLSHFDHFISAWRSIDSTVEVPFQIDLPIMPTRIPGKLAWQARSMWYKVTNHPFRIYIDLLDTKTIRTMKKNAKKVFGELL